MKHERRVYGYKMGKETGKKGFGHPDFDGKFVFLFSIKRERRFYGDNMRGKRSGKNGVGAQISPLNLCFCFQ